MNNPAQDDNTISIGHAAKILGISTRTLLRWEEKGIVSPERTQGGQRRYLESEIYNLGSNLKKKRPTIFVPTVVDQSTVTSQTDFPSLYDTLPKKQKGIAKITGIALFTVIAVTLLTQIIGAKNIHGFTNRLGVQLGLIEQKNKLAKTTSPSVLAAEAIENPVFGVNVDAIFRGTVNFLQGLTTTTLDTTGDTNIGGALTITGDTTANGDVTVNGALNLTDDLVIAGSLLSTEDTVELLNTGSTTINIGGEATTITLGATTGETTVNNNLVVTGTSDLNGAVTAGSTLSVSGNTTLSGAVTAGSSLTISGLIDVNGTGTNDIAGTLNLSGNILSSSGDLSILPGGGGISIGTGTASDIDLADGDLYITDDLEVDGTIYGTFAGSVNTGFTEGSVVFIDSAGGLDEDNNNFFWNDTTNRLGIGTTNPQYGLHVVGTLGTSGNTTIGGNTLLSGTLEVDGISTFDNAIIVNNTASFTSTSDFEDTLNLSGNSLTSTGDLVISAGGGGTKIGTGTPVSVNMAGDDLYVTGDFEVGGTIYGGLSGTVTTSFSGGSVVFTNGGGNLAEDNSNFFWDDTNNRLSLGTNSGATTTLYVSGSSLVTGASTFNGNLVLGDATSDTLTITSRIAGNLVPTTASTYDLGDATRTWETLYVDNIVAANISTTATDLNGTSASSFTINNDNATADTESSSLVFDRGTPSVNAILGWNATTPSTTTLGKYVYTNSPTFAINPSSETNITYSGKAALLVNQVQNQDIIAASASGSTRFKVDIDGEITASGIGKVKIVDGNEYARTCAGINAAIDDLGANGGEVFLPEGTYTCAETITIDANNTTIRGAGVGSIIQPTAGMTSAIINAGNRNHTKFKDFQINGSNQTSGNVFISLVVVQYVSIDNVYFTNSDNAAVYVNNATNIIMSNNSFTSNVYGVQLANNGPIGIKIVGNSFNSNTTGISCASSSNLSVSGNSFQSETTDISNSGCNNAAVTGNIFASSSTMIQSPGDNWTITGNTFLNPTSRAIQSVWTSGNKDYTIISSNSFTGNGTASVIAIDFDGLSAGQFSDEQLLITNNNIHGFSGSGSIGIRLDNTPDGALIVNNQFENNTTDISDSGTNTTFIGSEDGNTVIGSVDSTPDTTLEIFRSSGADTTFSMTDGDVAHGLTTLANTDAFLHIGAISSTAGGTAFTAISDTDAQAFKLTGVIGSTNPTDTTAAIKLIGGKSNGTTGMADLGDAETVFAIANNDNSDALYITGDGNVNTPRLNKTIVVDGTVYAKTCAGINAAIDALGSSGGEIFLPQGTYTCAETITIDYDNTTIRGTGPSSHIDASASNLSPVITLNTKDYITLTDFKITHSAGGSGGNTIQENSTSGIYSDYAIITNLSLINSDNDAILMLRGSYNRIDGNYISSPDGYAINIGNSGSGSYFKVINNNIVNGYIANQATSTNISNNHITTGSIYLSSGANAIVQGNTILSSPTYGIYAPAGGGYQTIISNNISNPTYFGIQAITGDYNVISNNKITDNGNGTNYDGINVSSGSDYNTITGNSISGFTASGASGIEITSSDNVVSGNQLEGNTTDISDSGTNTSIINSEDGNTVIGGADATPDTTLEIFRASGSDSTFSMTDGDVAHGLTTLANTDAFLHIGAISSTAGGAAFTAISDTDAQALSIRGIIGSTDPTDTTSAVKIIGGKSNGTTGIADLGAAETVFSVANNDDANALTVYGDGSLVVGAPTGGAKGVGTINAVAVYDDNVLLTDYVFDKYFDGTVRPEDMDKHSDYQMLSIDEMGQYVKDNRHLPTIAGRDEWLQSGKFSLGALVTDIWETTETNSLYILQLNDKVKNLSLGDDETQASELISDIQNIQEKQSQMDTKLAEQEDKISQLMSDVELLKSQTLIATSSATVAGVTDGPETLTQASESGTVNITSLGDTVITGKLNIGTMQFDSLSSSIDAIGELNIQPLALGDVRFMANQITFDTKGNITIKEGHITGNDSFRDQITVMPGQTEIRVEKDWDEAPKTINVTTSYFTNSLVTNITESGFTIKLQEQSNEEQQVYWVAYW